MTTQVVVVLTTSLNQSLVGLNWKAVGGYFLFTLLDCCGCLQRWLLSVTNILCLLWKFWQKSLVSQKMLQVQRLWQQGDLHLNFLLLSLVLFKKVTLGLVQLLGLLCSTSCLSSECVPFTPEKC